MSTQECENHHASYVPATPDLQMEFWVRKGREAGKWIPQHLMFGIVTDGYTPWRRVKPGHKHKDKLAHSIAPRVRLSDNQTAGRVTSRTDKVSEYLDWAARKSLHEVTVYANDPVSMMAGARFRTKTIAVSEILGPAPDDEYDCYGDWDHDGAEEATA